MPVSRAAAAAAAALAVMSACSSGPNAAPPQPTSTPAPAHARLVADRCADLIVLGVRGQAQPAHAAAGVGAEVQNSTWALVEQLRGGERVRLEAVTYPARAVSSRAAFDHDVEAGRLQLVARHALLASACPNSRFVVIGFSEGADVVHRAVASMSAKQASNLAVVAVLGDPLRNSTDHVATETYGSGHLKGRGSISGGPRWGKEARARVISFCTAHDNVCNAPAAGRRTTISTVHRTFYEKRSSARVTAARMAQMIGAK